MWRKRAGKYAHFISDERRLLSDDRVHEWHQWAVAKINWNNCCAESEITRICQQHEKGIKEVEDIFISINIIIH